MARGRASFRYDGDVARTLKTRIQAAAADCYARFCAVPTLVDWVPGLVRAELVGTDGDGRPAEVRFVARLTDGRTLEYTLLYAHDAPRRRVAWMPGDNTSNAVRGFATFDEAPGGGCEMCYALELQSSRTEDADEMLAEARRVVEAFKQWTEARR